MDKVVEGLDLEQVALGIWLDGVAELKGTVIRKSVAAVKWLAAHRAADFDWLCRPTLRVEVDAGLDSLIRTLTCLCRTSEDTC